MDAAVLMPKFSILFNRPLPLSYVPERTRACQLSSCKLALPFIVKALPAYNPVSLSPQTWNTIHYFMELWTSHAIYFDRKVEKPQKQASTVSYAAFLWGIKLAVVGGFNNSKHPTIWNFHLWSLLDLSALANLGIRSYDSKWPVFCLDRAPMCVWHMIKKCPSWYGRQHSFSACPRSVVELIQILYTSIFSWRIQGLLDVPLPEAKEQSNLSLFSACQCHSCISLLTS